MVKIGSKYQAVVPEFGTHSALQPEYVREPKLFIYYDVLCTKIRCKMRLFLKHHRLAHISSFWSREFACKQTKRVPVRTNKKVNACGN